MAALAAASALACLATSTPASAQEEKRTYVYAYYFHCDAAKLSQADDAVNKLYKPVYDAGVADGTIKAWAWAAHNVGGEWMRLGYHTGPSLKAVIDANNTLDSRTNTKTNKENAKLDKSFNEACGTHEDYIWASVAGKDVQGHRGNATFSTYYVCDSSREKQADALVKRVFAPMYDKMVADGKLVSWGWFEHMLGGKYRRLATMTAANVDALLEARMAIGKMLENDPLGEDFSGICGSHQDYMWDLKVQAP
jgi:hypothetical protein